MRPEKSSIVEEIKGHLRDAEYVVLADYRGLTVRQTTELRSKLRGVGARVKVVKNTQLGVAAGLAGKSVICQSVNMGPTALVTGRGDVVDVAKLLKQFIADNGSKPVVKGGCLGVRVLSPADVEALAEMPPRNVLLGQFVGTLAAPISGIVGVLNQRLVSILYVLKAVMDKKSSTEQKA